MKYFEIILNQQTPFAKDLINLKDKKAIFFINGFCDFARTISNLAGLAANQVAYDNTRINARFFVMVKDDIIKPIINPEIIKVYGDTAIMHEGCKTWPGKTIIAKRYYKIDVGYYTFDGSIQETLIGFDAQVFQHEMNHLDGIEEKFIYANNNVGRNEPCPCGSGIKFKKCCGVV